MSHRLPPLNGLRAFEAAARHLSFTRAADELSVTAGAVSQQVKALEDALGVALFRRLPRSLVLTQAGESYLPAITSAFEIISKATEMNAPALRGRKLRLGVTPRIA
jgi:LysR family glycine cleavage system transcriptional activator